MDWLEPAQWQAAAVCLVACGALGWLVPALIARVPEPEPERGPEAEERQLFDRSLPPPVAKVPYATIAAAPHLGVRAAAASALVGGAFGAALGWAGALLYLVPLVPIGVALMIIDARTTLLPTKILRPTYVLLAVLVPIAALVDRDLDALYRAGWGWLVIGLWFYVIWWATNAWGFGDVRLARVLGPALGYLGWAELLMGLTLILLVGGVGGLLVLAVTRDARRRVPYGPYMLIGAALAVVAGPWLARSLGY